MSLRAKPKPEMRQLRDGRVILTGKLYQRLRETVCELAGKFCEVADDNGRKCGKYTPVFLGHVHHGRHRGMGSAQRDDRIFVRGEQRLFWACPDCHRGIHVPAKVVPAKVNDEELREILGLDGKDHENTSE